MSGSHQAFQGGRGLVLPIALVVPVKNEAATLPELFAALGRSTCWPAELAFCDAGSIDQTVAVIEAWWEACQRPDVILSVRQKAGALPGEGRNLGVAATSAEWVAFIDAGVEPEPDWLERLYRCAESGGRDHAFGLCRFDGRTDWTLAVCALTNGVGRTAPVLPASIFRRRLLERIGPFPEKLRSAEDLLWLGRFDALHAPRHLCPEAGVHYTHYPEAPKAVIRKWFAFERSSVRAGVGQRMRVLYLLATVILAGLLAVAPMVGMASCAGYLLLRGVFDPVRRSRSAVWWRSYPVAVVLAPMCALCIDTGKLLGGIAGLMEKHEPERH